MLKKTRASKEIEDPFLSGKVEDIWAWLDKGSKPVSKEELLRRIKAIRKKNGLD